MQRWGRKKKFRGKGFGKGTSDRTTGHGKRQGLVGQSVGEGFEKGASDRAAGHEKRQGLVAADGGAAGVED